MKALALLAAICLSGTADAWVEETGTLREFMFGTNPGSAYDNWNSHVSEGVARPGYNDYGPSWFDPQTNGFGAYEIIPSGAAGDSTLARWKAVFLHALRGEWTIVDSLIAREDTVWNYELVHFTDNELNQDFFMLRERLDSSFVDVNVDTITGDEVIGSFRKGWGLYAFQPFPRLPEVGIQLPHPEDDFLSIPVGLEMFLQMGTEVLMIAGAGREVNWDSSGGADYTNNRSLSDPTRVRRSVFAICHEAMVDEWGRGWDAESCVIQLHSYDHAAHGALADIQTCAFRDDSAPNLPLRDRAEHLDIINALPRFPVNGLDGDETILAEVDDYIGLWSSPGYSWYGPGGPLPIPVVSDLIGNIPNQQATYSHVGHNVFVDPEVFLHIEIDEYPDRLWTPVDWARWLPDSAPVANECFDLTRDYYQAFVSAVDSGLWWEFYLEDTTAPLTVEPYQATLLINDEVYLRWSGQAADRFFDTYLVYYDTVAVGPQSPYLSRADAAYANLADFATHEVQFYDLVPPVERYRFAIAARDLNGLVSDLSPAIGLTDSSIQDLTIIALGDSVELCWRPQQNDRQYNVFVAMLGDTASTLLGSTTATFYRVSTDIAPEGSGSVTFQVVRLILD